MITRLAEFAQQGHGVIIGRPGIGKSYAIAELSSQLMDQDIPVFVFAIDMLQDGSDETIEAEIGINENWISYLEKIKLPDEATKAVLIFDAYDAARDENLRKQFFYQIKKAIASLTKWNIIVSVRTYDASKSPQLLNLFQPINTSVGVIRRTFEIKELNEQELESALQGSLVLNKIYDSSSDELRSILKVPFFLKLFEIVVKDFKVEDSYKIQLIKSESELLDSFWIKKVSNTENAYGKEILLSKLAERLVEDMKLSCPKDDFIQNSNIFMELRSDDIISEVGVADRYVAFSHNILFDYMVGRLIIPVDPVKMLEFIRKDKARPFFLRPSFIYHFTRLWYNHRVDFWENYLHLNKESDPSFNLFRRLIPITIIANEYEQINDLGPIFQEVESTRHLLQSIRFLNDRGPVDRDLDLLLYLSNQLHVNFLWDFSFVFQKLLDNSKDAQEDDFDKLGIIARRFLAFILDIRNNTSAAKQSLDRLGSARGLEFVSKTYASNVSESRFLLERILYFLNEEDFDIWYFSSLSDDIKYFVGDDPDFVAKIYLKIFDHQEESTEETSMGGTVIMNLRSNRKQDFEMCHYRLVEYFPTFIRVAPEIALKAGIEIVNNYVIKDKQRLTADQPEFKMVSINQIHASFLPDYSSMWHDFLTYHQPAQLGVKIIQYFKELINAGAAERLNALLKIYITNAKAGFLWKKLIELGNENVPIFRDYLFELATNQTILYQSETTYEIGVSIRAIYSGLEKDEREEIEKAIITWRDSENDKSYREHEVIRLLNCIPENLIVRDDAKSLVFSNPSVKNQPTFSTTWTSEPYTTNQWLQDKGINLSDEKNKEVLHLISRLEAFNHQRMNDSPVRSQFAELLPVAESLFELMIGINSFEEDIRFSAVKELSKFFSIISRTPLFLEEKDYEIAKDAVIYGMNFRSGYDEAYGESSSPSTGYAPTPRIEASSALTGLLRYKNDSDIFQIIRTCITDSNPIVRFNILRNFYDVWAERPDEFWDLVFERIENEKDSFTLSVIFSNIYHSEIIENNEGNVTKAVQSAAKRLSGYGQRDPFLESYVVLLLFLYGNKKNQVARDIIYANLASTSFIQTLTFKLFSFIDPKYPSNDYENKETNSELLDLLYDITKHNLGLLKTVDLSSLDEEGEDRKRILLVDNIIQRIYFALHIDERITNNHELDPNEKNKRAFYNRVKQVLLAVIEKSREIGGGLIVAHTAHYIIETLNGVIKFYPEEAASILEMVSSITLLSIRTGYPFDPSAVKEVVNLTETLLADHKQLLRNSDSLSQLVLLLNVYVESGWSEALELLWKLDEAFR